MPEPSRFFSRPREQRVTILLFINTLKELSELEQLFSSAGFAASRTESADMAALVAATGDEIQRNYRVLTERASALVKLAEEQGVDEPTLREIYDSYNPRKHAA
jgi:hypothetical protein